MLAIGYPLYWAEMLGGSARTGGTSPAAAVLWTLFAVFVFMRERQAISDGLLQGREWLAGLTGGMRILVFGVLGLCAAILAIACYASLYPIHLMQEGDALNYHYSLTRQHLILQSFAHIPWSAFDLFLLPVNFALAPFWFATELPNKIPQFIFLVGLILIMFRIAQFLNGASSISGLLVLALFLGSHGHGIQFGTAMLDLVNCYLFFAMADSLIHRVKWLFIIEASFYLWAKPFVPVQSVMVVLSLCLVIMVLQKFGLKELYFDARKKIGPVFWTDTTAFLKRCTLGFVVVSALVAGPFVAKSLYYAGTPLFPFFPGVIGQHKIPEGSPAWASLNAASDYWLTFTRNSYGHGRSFGDLISHFWLIAVPSNGVNNSFDYPLGLSYLIVLGPFLYFWGKSLRERKVAFFYWLTLVVWLSWFMGSQQSRWLYLPLTWMFILVSTQIIKPSKILLGVLMVALTLNVVSLARAHGADFKKSRQDVLRQKDKVLLELNSDHIRAKEQGYRVWDDAEVAFARFPVMIEKENLPNVIAH